MDRPKRTPKRKSGTRDVLKLSLPKASQVYELFWKFAAERQNIFFRKLRNDLIVTQDPILDEYKFTNAYRASDRTSQYLINNVLYTGPQTPEEIFFRCLIFKKFNRIGTWELLQSKLGRDVSWSTYNYDEYNNILLEATSKGGCIYSAAYMHPSFGAGLPYKRKHQCHLKLIEMMMKDELPLKIHEAGSLAQVFKLIRGYTMIGDFLAYQYTTDLNYSSMINFDEMDFTSAGPGAIGGISKCFEDLGDFHENDIIKMVADRQELEFEARGIQFYNLWGRRLQLIDIQNLFCETDKYSRVALPEIRGKSEGVRIKQKYKLSRSAPVKPYYPPKWGLNSRLETIPPVPLVTHLPEGPRFCPQREVQSDSHTCATPVQPSGNQGDLTLPGIL